jgi:signal transduction histidine kinase
MCSRRSGLWLSDALVITFALGIVTLVVLTFLIRNPLASREIQQHLQQPQKMGVQLQLKVPDELPTLIGDGDRLAQVFTNLVENALTLTPTHGIHSSGQRGGGDGCFHTGYGPRRPERIAASSI